MHSHADLLAALPGSVTQDPITWITDKEFSMYTDIATRLGRITVARIDAALEPIISERGHDFVYPPYGPYFFGGSGPSCLVGQILAAFGLTTHDAHLAGVTGGTTVNLIERLRLDIDPVAAVYLIALQMHNDQRQPWGQAAEEAWAHVLEVHAGHDPRFQIPLGYGYTHIDKLVRRFMSGPCPSKTGELVRVAEAVASGTLAPVMTDLDEELRELVREFQWQARLRAAEREVEQRMLSKSALAGL